MSELSNEVKDEVATKEIAQYFNNYVASKKIENESDRKALSHLFRALKPIDVMDAMICCNIVTMQHALSLTNKILISNSESESYNKASYKRVRDMSRNLPIMNESLMKAMRVRQEYLNSLNQRRKELILSAKEFTDSLEVK